MSQAFLNILKDNKDALAVVISFIALIVSVFTLVLNWRNSRRLSALDKPRFRWERGPEIMYHGTNQAPYIYIKVCNLTAAAASDITLRVRLSRRCKFVENIKKLKNEVQGQEAIEESIDIVRLFREMENTASLRMEGRIELLVSYAPRSLGRPVNFIRFYGKLRNKKNEYTLCKAWRIINSCWWKRVSSRSG